MTPEERAMAEKVVAGFRKALEELVVPEVRAITEEVRRQNRMLDEWNAKLRAGTPSPNDVKAP